MQLRRDKIRHNRAPMHLKHTSCQTGLSSYIYISLFCSWYPPLLTHHEVMIKFGYSNCSILNQIHSGEFSKLYDLIKTTLSFTDQKKSTSLRRKLGLITMDLLTSVITIPGMPTGTGSNFVPGETLSTARTKPIAPRLFAVSETFLIDAEPTTKLNE